MAFLGAAPQTFTGNAEEVLRRDQGREMKKRILAVLH
jgi:hypothetical protein